MGFNSKGHWDFGPTKLSQLEKDGWNNDNCCKYHDYLWPLIIECFWKISKTRIKLRPNIFFVNRCHAFLKISWSSLIPEFVWGT